MATRNRPSIDILLESCLSLELWHAAEKQAIRSGLGVFRTGAVVFDKYNRILSTGCSHVSNKHTNWIHAEENACSRMWPALRKFNARCVIVTLSQSGGWAWSSRPCARCFNKLNHYNIDSVVYAEKCNDGSWAIREQKISEIMPIVKKINLGGKYARDMRVPDVVFA